MAVPGKRGDLDLARRLEEPTAALGWLLAVVLLAALAPAPATAADGVGFERAWGEAGMRGPYDVAAFDHAALGSGVFVGGSSGGIAAVTGDGVAWRYRPGAALSAMATGDLTGDGQPDVAAGFFTDRVVVVSGASGVAVAETGLAGVPDDLAVADATGDGRDDVYVVTRGGDHRVTEQRNTVWLLRGDDLSPLWTVTFEADEGIAAAAAGDLDGDGRADVVVGTRSNGPRLRAFDADGAPLWEADPGGAVTDLAVADGGETVLATVSGTTLVAVDGASGALRWTALAPGGGSSFAQLAVADLTGDGSDEAVWVVYGTSGYGATQQVIATDVASGLLLWTQPTLVPAKGLAVGDLDGDGLADVAVSTENPFGLPETGTNTNHVSAYAGATGQRLWTHALVGSETTFLSRLAVVDVTGDGDAEVVVASRFDVLLGLAAADGAEVWRARLGAAVNAAVAGQLTGDDRPAVVTGDEAFDVVARDADSGQERWRTGLGAQVYALALAANEDGGADVVAVTHTGAHRVAGADGALAWSLALPGQGVDAVAVGDGLVAVAARTSANPRHGITYNHTGVVYLVEAATGAVRWQAPVQAPVGLALGDADPPDLLVAGRGVTRGSVTAFDGALLATAPVARWVTPTPGNGAAVKLAAAGGQVLLVEPGTRTVAALDAGDGSQRWQVGLPESVRALGFGDPDGDGLPDALVGLATFTPRVAAVAGADGAILFDVDTGVNWLSAARWADTPHGPQLVLAHGEQFSHDGRLAVLDGAAALDGTAVERFVDPQINAGGLAETDGGWVAYGWTTQRHVLALIRGPQ